MRSHRPASAAVGSCNGSALANVAARVVVTKSCATGCYSGNRKRQILECLAEVPPQDGWSAEALARNLEIGSATVYETLTSTARREASRQPEAAAAPYQG